MGHRDTVLDLIRSEPGLSDAQIRERTGISPHQQVNQICRRLEAMGLTERRTGQHGRIINLPRGVTGPTAAPPPPAGIAPRRALAQPNQRSHPTARANQGIDPLATLDPTRTLIILACSGRKRPGGYPALGPGVLDILPEPLSARMRDVRRNIAIRANLDESALMPAWRRYTGTFFAHAVSQLRSGVADGSPMLILSGGYGALLPTEPIGIYDAIFKLHWWPRGLIEGCLVAYARAAGVSTVIAFLSSSTDYAKAVRATQWSQANVAAAFLVSPDLGDQGGARVKVPRAAAEAFNAFRQCRLHVGWRSSDGLALSVERLV